MAIMSSPTAIVPEEEVDNLVVHQPPKDDNTITRPSVSPSTSHFDDILLLFSVIRHPILLLHYHLALMFINNFSGKKKIGI